VTMILNDGLNCIACETATANIARGVLGEGRDQKEALKKGDSVHAWLLTNCNEQKTKDGGTFMANRTKVYHIDKIPDFETEPPTF